RLTNSACFLSPDTCQSGDPADKALQDEISALVRETLVAGGPDGGLSLYSLKRKAGLLALSAKVMAAITQRAAARLATEVATQRAALHRAGARAGRRPRAPTVRIRRRLPAATVPHRATAGNSRRRRVLRRSGRRRPIRDPRRVAAHRPRASVRRCAARAPAPRTCAPRLGQHLPARWRRVPRARRESSGSAAAGTAPALRAAAAGCARGSSTPGARARARPARLRTSSDL